MNKINLFLKTCRLEGFKIAVLRTIAVLLGVRISGFYETEENKENFLQQYMIPEEAVRAPALINASVRRAMFYEPERTVELVNTCVAQELINYGKFLNETGTDIYRNRKNVFEAALMFPGNQKYSEHLAENILNQWQWEGASGELLERCGQVIRNHTVKRTYVKKIYMIYVSSLMELKEKKRAKAALKEYTDKFGKQGIHLVYPVALLAEEMGISNDKIHKAAMICNVIIKNKNLLEQYITGKSAAVVGSGPYELGRNLGKEIDSHDVVIRFNDYQINRFEQDYGRKTNIWVRNIDTENGGCDPRLDEIQDFDLVVLESNIWRFFIPEMFLNVFYEYAVKNGNKLYMLKYRDKMIQEMGSFPTSGGQLLFELCQIKNKIKMIDVYGFSYMYSVEKNSKVIKHNSDKEETYRHGNLHHNLCIETAFLKNLMSGTNVMERDIKN